MGISDWINLIAAILVGGGTLALAVMAYKAIRQTRGIQRSEKKERLLNEIVEWAIDVTKWRPKEIYKDMIDLSDELRLRKLIYSHIVGIMESFIEMRGRNQYLSNISAMFSKDLEEAVGNLIDTLETKIELLSEWKSTIANAISKGVKEDDEHYFQKAEEQEYQIERLALKVIEEATKIKTQNIRKKEETMSKEGEVTGSNEPTIKDIEAHLIRQDKEMQKSNWLTFAAFGAAIALLGLSLAIVEDRFYYWVVAIGVVVMIMSRINAKRIDTKK